MTQTQDKVTGTIAKRGQLFAQERSGSYTTADFKTVKTLDYVLGQALSVSIGGRVLAYRVLGDTFRIKAAPGGRVLMIPSDVDSAATEAAYVARSADMYAREFSKLADVQDFVRQFRAATGCAKRVGLFTPSRIAY